MTLVITLTFFMLLKNTAMYSLFLSLDLSRHPHPQMVLIMVTHMGAPFNHNKHIINSINVPCEPNPSKAILWLATSYWKGDHSPTLLSLFCLETRIYTKGKEYNHTNAECSTHSGCVEYFLGRISYSNLF